MRDSTVAVTGMGVICAIGGDTVEFASSLKSGTGGIGFLPEPAMEVQMGAELSGFDFKARLSALDCPPDLQEKAESFARRSPRHIQVAVLACLEAYCGCCPDSFFPAPIPAERMGLVVGGNNLTRRYQYLLEKKFAKNPEYLNPRYAIHYQDTDHVGTLSRIFDIHGEGFTVGGASASGNMAIVQGVRLVQAGVADLVMVVGAMADLSPMELMGYRAIGALGGKRFADRPDRACRPFDTKAEGFIHGHGCGCLILESIRSAKNRGASLLAEIPAAVAVLDANESAEPGMDGEVRAMRNALSMAGILPDQVDYLNAHGSSSPLGDKTEVAAIRKVFENHASKLRINATKALTGHCLTSAGVIEAAASIIQMRSSFVHPNINLDDPIDDEIGLVGKKAENAKIRVAMSNAYGFGGINTCVILT